MALQDGTQLQNISFALQNLGAGLQGNMPQLQAARTQQQESQMRQQMLQQEQQSRQQQAQQQAALERQKTVFTDANAALNLLEADNLDGVVGLGMQRLQLLQHFPGADPSDTQRLTRLAIAAKNGSEEAKTLLRDELKTTVEIGREMGIIERPESQILTSNQVIDGQVVQQGPDGSLSSQQVPGFTARSNEPATRAREAEIQDLMSTFNMSRADAIKSLMEKTFVDPTTGNLMTRDPIGRSGEIVQMNVPDETAELGTPPEFQMEDVTFDPAKGTGFASSFLGLWNNTVGQIPFVPIARNTAEAAQNLRILERDAINALATSSRPAVVEQERILAALPKAMEWFENPQDAQMKMLSFLDIMSQQYVDDLRYSSNLRNPRTLREESSRRANQVERIMGRVLTPEASEQMLNSINRVEQEMGDVIDMPLTELLSLDPSTLTDTQLEAMERRLRDGGN